MEHDEAVPEADALEQDEPLEDADAELGVGTDEAVPEADALEQHTAVDASKRRVPVGSPGEVSEADWLEQSIVEPLDDEER